MMFSQAEKAINDYRDQTGAMAAGPGTTATQMCTCCKQCKAMFEGRRVTAIPGKITRHNPAIFVCSQCYGIYVNEVGADKEIPLGGKFFSWAMKQAKKAAKVEK